MGKPRFLSEGVFSSIGVAQRLLYESIGARLIANIQSKAKMCNEKRKRCVLYELSHSCTRVSLFLSSLKRRDVIRAVWPKVCNKAQPHCFQNFNAACKPNSNFPNETRMRNHTRHWRFIRNCFRRPQKEYSSAPGRMPSQASSFRRTFLLPASPDFVRIRPETIGEELPPETWEKSPHWSWRS